MLFIVIILRKILFKSEVFLMNVEMQFYCFVSQFPNIFHNFNDICLEFQKNFFIISRGKYFWTIFFIKAYLANKIYFEDYLSWFKKIP